MPKRGENIRKRKDGRWESRFIKGRGPDGGAKYQSVYGSSYIETKGKLQRAAANCKTESLPAPNKNMSFLEALFLWLASRRIKLRQQTYAKYSRMIDSHLAESIGGYKMSQINAAVINSFIMQKMLSGRLDNGGGLSVSYVRTLILIIRSAVSFGAAQGYNAPLCGEISELPKKKPGFVVFTADEQARLEHYMQSNIDGMKLASVMRSIYLDDKMIQVSKPSVT